jgi:hypothetical protein
MSEASPSVGAGAAAAAPVEGRNGVLRVRRRRNGPISMSQAGADEVEVESFQPRALYVVCKTRLGAEFGPLCRQYPRLGGSIADHGSRSFALEMEGHHYATVWVSITLHNAGRRGGQKQEPRFAVRITTDWHFVCFRGADLAAPTLPRAAAYEIRFGWATGAVEIPTLLPFSAGARAHCERAVSDLSFSVLEPWLHRRRRRVESELRCLPRAGSAVWLRDVAPLRELVLDFLLAHPRAAPRD